MNDLKEKLLIVVNSDIEKIKDLTYNGIGFQEFTEGWIKKHYEKFDSNGVYNPPLDDLTRFFSSKEEIFEERSALLFRDILKERITENTPHGEHGVTEYSENFIIFNEQYRATISNVRWDRLDKQYYFIDPYHTPKIKIEKV